MSLTFIVEKICPVIQTIGAISIPIALWWLTNISSSTIAQQQKNVRASQAIQNYLNKISELKEKGLQQDIASTSPEQHQELRAIARAYTIALLRNPDLQRDKNSEADFKGQAIEYLSDLALIHTDVKIVDKAGIQEYQCVDDKPNISLERANLSGANLEFIFACHANFQNANLQNVNLTGAYLEGANFTGANFEGATGLAESQLSEAIVCETILPNYIEIDSNRDCKN